jgi:hypothetical protein
MGANTSKLHVFRAGKHTTAAGESVEFSADDIAQIAAVYDPKVYQAPLVVGHPKTDDPAFGWVGCLSANGSELFAEPASDPPVDSQFAAMVNDGKFRNISVALWPPGHPSSPRKEGYYLRHVGFLGATAPSVKGLTPAQFSGDADKLVTIEFSNGDEAERASLFEKLKSILSPKSTSEALKPAHFSEETEMTDEQKKALDAREVDLAKKEKEFADAKAAFEIKQKADAHAVEVSKHSAWVEDQAKAGKILPTQKVELSEALASLSGVAEIEFADGDAKVKKSPLEIVKAAIVGKTIDFSEKSKGQPGTGKVINFNGPRDMKVDDERAKLHSAALEYAEKNKVDYVVAVAAIERQQQSA